MAVEEEDGKGGKQRSTEAKDSRKGTPQGSPISPLLSNLYLRRFILGWKKLGWRKRFAGKIVSYGDDFVILCKAGAAHAAREAMEALMGELKLKVNERKTRVAKVPEESFDFLGYTFGKCHSPRGKGSVIAPSPSKKATKKIKEAMSEATQPSQTGKSTAELIAELNQQLRGWKAYFQVGWCSKAYRSVDSHNRHRLRQWLNRKHHSRGYTAVRYSAPYLHETLGLARIFHKWRCKAAPVYCK